MRVLPCPWMLDLINFCRQQTGLLQTVSCLLSLRVFSIKRQYLNSCLIYGCTQRDREKINYIFSIFDIFLRDPSLCYMVAYGFHSDDTILAGKLPLIIIAFTPKLVLRFLTTVMSPLKNSKLRIKTNQWKNYTVSREVHAIWNFALFSNCVFKFYSRSILCTKSLHNTIRNLFVTKIWYPANADGFLAVL